MNRPKDEPNRWRMNRPKEEPNRRRMNRPNEEPDKNPTARIKAWGEKIPLALQFFIEDGECLDSNPKDDARQFRINRRQIRQTSSNALRDQENGYGPPINDSNEREERDIKTERKII